MSTAQPVQAKKRRALLIPTGGRLADGTYWDGVRRVEPTDDDYDERLLEAIRVCSAQKIPLPYAPDDDAAAK